MNAKALKRISLVLAVVVASFAAINCAGYDSYGNPVLAPAFFAPISSGPAYHYGHHRKLFDDDDDGHRYHRRYRHDHDDDDGGYHRGYYHDGDDDDDGGYYCEDDD